MSVPNATKIIKSQNLANMLDPLKINYSVNIIKIWSGNKI